MRPNRSARWSRPNSRIRLTDERSTLIRAPAARASSTARSAADPIGSHHQRVAGEVEPVRALEPLRLELVRREVRRDAAVRDHRPAPVQLDEGHHDAVPARPAAGRGRRRPAGAGRTRQARPRASAPRLPMKRASAPSAAAQAATFAACPPAPARVSPCVSSPSASGRCSFTTTSSSRSPRVQITRSTPRIVPWTARHRRGVCAHS